MFADIPLHPKLVHLPIALAVLMPLLSGSVLLAWWRGWFRQRTWTLVAATQLLLVGSAFVAMRTGEEDEERVEQIVAEHAIHEHEEAAESFSWAAVGVLFVCLMPLLSRRPKFALPAALAAFAGTGVVLALGVRVGQAGGELVYGHGAAAAFATGPGSTPVPAIGRRPDDEHR